MTPRAARRDAGRARVALALAGVLAAQAAARAGLAFVPSMSAWGLNELRFVPALPGAAAWLAMAVLLVPAVGRRAQPWLDRAGEAIAAGSWRPPLVAALVAIAVVGFLPDRTWFIGDFALRQGTAAGEGPLSQLVPGGPGQALPLDVALHVALPRALAGDHGIPVNATARAIGALDAALLALAALAFVRALDLTAAPAVVAAVTVFASGALFLCTGYGKALAELAVAVAWIGACGLGILRRRRGLLGLGVALALAISFHRAGLLLVPAAAYAMTSALRVRGGRRALREPAVVLTLLLPLVAAALVLPLAGPTLAGYDVARHLRLGGDGAAAGAFPVPSPGLRVADLANAILLACPLALAALAVAGSRRSGRDGGRRGEARFLALLVLPLLGLLVVVHPGQGVFRDLDVAVPACCALSLVVAWRLGGFLAEGEGGGRFAGALVAAVIVPVLLGLALQANPEAAFRRIETYAAGPPRRTEAERSTAWDFLGGRRAETGDWAGSALAYARAAETMPSPRILWGLGRAEAHTGRLEAAQAAFARLVEREPDALRGWVALGEVAARRGDLAEAWRAARELAARVPGDPAAQRNFAQMDSLRRALEQAGGRPDEP